MEGEWRQESEVKKENEYEVQENQGNSFVWRSGGSV